MKYDPINPLSSQELNSLPESEFFEYLDSKAAYLKTQSKPITEYHSKRFASLSSKIEGRELTDDDYQMAVNVGKTNRENWLGDKHDDMISKKHQMLKRVGVKNIKTNRKQFFN